VAAGVQAFKDSGLEIADANRARVGAAIGAGIGGLTNIEKAHASILENKGPKRVSPFFVPSSIINMIAGHLSIMYGFKGPNIAVVTACTTANHNIGLAMRCIQYGDAEVMLAGGAEMAVTPLGMGGFCAAARCPRATMRRNRPAAPGTGIATVLCWARAPASWCSKKYEYAKTRGARIYAELAGFGMSGDAYHMTAPPEDGEARACAWPMPCVMPASKLSRCNTSMPMELRPRWATKVKVSRLNAHSVRTPRNSRLVPPNR